MAVGRAVGGRVDYTHGHGRGRLANDAVDKVGEEHGAGRLDGDAQGRLQLGGSGRAAVAAVTSGAVAGNRDDLTGRLDHLADHVVI